MDRAEVGVFEETDEVGFGRLLKGEHGLRLESNVRLYLASQILNDPLEW